MISPKAEIQKSVNIYRQRIETGQGPGQFLLLKSPGLKAVFQPSGSTGQFRGNGLEQNGLVTLAIDNKVYILDAFNHVKTTYGPQINNDGGVVRFAASLTSVMFVSAGKLYRADGVTIVDKTPAGVVFVDVVYIGSYYVGITNTTSFYFSSDDGVTWPAANLQSAQASSNFFVGALNHQEFLHIFGNRVTQVFAVGSNANQPFVAQQSATIPMGAETVGSIQSIGVYRYWLGRAKEGEYVVYRAKGWEAQRISNFAVENAIRGYATQFGVTDAFAEVYRLNGQDYYRLIFPKANASWELNSTLTEAIGVPEWGEIAYQQMGQANFQRHRANMLVSAFGSLYAGDYQNGWWYEFTPDQYTDYGFPLPFLRRAPQIVQGALTIAFDRLELIIETGVGLDPPLWLNTYSMSRPTFMSTLATEVGAGRVTAAQQTILQAIYDLAPYIPLTGPNAYPSYSEMVTTLGFVPWGNYAQVGSTLYGGPPQIGLQYSNNGGKNFTPVLYRSLGQKGTDPKVYWDRLGASNARVFQLTGDGPNKLAIVTAFLDSEVTLR
jgi:hypothetical protein